LPELNGNPLTHDILAALGLLETKQDGSGESEPFEEDCEKLQSKLLAEGAGYVQRRGSFSSDSEHSQHSHPHSASTDTPRISKPHQIFRDNFNFQSASASPISQSPVPRQRQSYPPAQKQPVQVDSPLQNDPQLYQPDWTLPDMNRQGQSMQPKQALQTADLNFSDLDGVFSSNQFDASQPWSDAEFGGLPITSYPQQLSTAFGGSIPDFSAGLDDMELFIENRFISPIQV